MAVTPNDDRLHILHLEPYDDTVSLRDQLSAVRARYVLLVLPRRTSIFRRKLDLLLVQRHANRMGARIALVTRDPVVEDHAHELDISVFPDEQTAQQGRWKRSRTKVFSNPRDPVEQVAIAEHVSRMRDGTSVGFMRRWRPVIRWGAFWTLLAALLLGFFLVAPSATVTLTPASKQVFERVSVVADPTLNDIDIETYRIPAAPVTLQATSRVTVESSGMETAGTTLAQGLVTFYNLTDQPILIPLGTVVATGGTYPVRFSTQIETTLTAGTDSSVQVPVQALEAHAGAMGNVDPGEISRVEAVFADSVYVTNPNATYGGTIQERRVVTTQDHDRLLVLGRQQVLQNARDILLHQLSGGQFLVPGSVSIVGERPEWTLFNAPVGDPVESVSLDLRAEVQAIVIDERQAQQVAFAGLAPYIEPGHEISPEALSFSRGDIISIQPDGQVSFLMVVRGNIAVSIDEDRVREQLAGLTVSEAKSRLNRELLLDPDRPPQIDTWPGWFGRLPVLPVRITVKVQVP